MLIHLSGYVCVCVCVFVCLFACSLGQVLTSLLQFHSWPEKWTNNIESIIPSKLPFERGGDGRGRRGGDLPFQSQPVQSPPPHNQLRAGHMGK